MKATRVSPEKRLIMILSAVLCIVGGFAISFYTFSKFGGFANSLGSMVDSGFNILRNIGDLTDIPKAPKEYYIFLAWPLIVGLTGIVFAINSFSFKKWIRILGYIAAFSGFIFSAVAFIGAYTQLADKNIDLFDLLSIGFYIGVTGQIVGLVGVLIKK
ncbi:MAG: hypothetical protein A2W91_20480 [Bacteroidetes bacterium GWF2_38_335]|nr:MAG: hypothetical protein A2W91_20480 [Bacteroidetes bacterium GWF2_38_335]OFY79467.1 MAG: hypothetical protein A2281_13605 [Bacteroidetes bacterium RIFOXYA12_FULL_38_20]HBS86597.1 hypothetical protein [Bacteroidales bacterium]